MHQKFLNWLQKNKKKVVLRGGKKINIVLVPWFLNMHARVRKTFFFIENFILVDKHRFSIERQGM